MVLSRPFETKESVQSSVFQTNSVMTNLESLALSNQPILIAEKISTLALSEAGRESACEQLHRLWSELGSGEISIEIAVCHEPTRRGHFQQP